MQKSAAMGMERNAESKKTKENLTRIRHRETATSKEQTRAFNAFAPRNSAIPSLEQKNMFLLELSPPALCSTCATRKTQIADDLLDDVDVEQSVDGLSWLIHGVFSYCEIMVG